MLWSSNSTAEFSILRLLSSIFLIKPVAIVLLSGQIQTGIRW